MEDAHSFVVDFDAVRGQGFFAVFDGHAGKHAAEWCGSHFHEVRRRQFISEWSTNFTGLL
jgi:protein phosphatase PTC1